MKVLYLTNIPSPYRTDFFNELGELCDLTVLYERVSARDRDSGWLELNTTRFQAVVLNGVKRGADSALCPSVIKWLDAKRFDIIVLGGYSTPTGVLASMYMRVSHIPYILNVDGGIIKNDAGVKRKLKSFLMNGAEAYITSGIKSEEYLRHYGVTAPMYQYPFTSVHRQDILSAPVSAGEKRKYREKLGIKTDFMALAVGQFIHRKGFDVLLKAWRDVKGDAALCLAGGSPTNEYAGIIQDLSLSNIIFPGFVNHAALKDYYMAADVFVLPTREDIWGLVINEAMAYGLPVISTDSCVAALTLLKDGQGGYIVPAGDEDGLSEALNTLFEQRALRDKMSHVNLETIKGYTITQMAARHMELFGEVQKRGG